jgi:feruloyl esterase
VALWVASAVLKDQASYIPPAKYPVVHQAALDACDARDGVKDGVIDDPTRCKFDPKSIECKNADGPSCLTAPQVDAAKKIYGAGKPPFSTLVPGTELGWAVLGGPEPSSVMLDHYKYVVFKDPNYDWRKFDFEKDTARAENPEFTVMNATNPNMTPYFGHNGKLLMYHGWSDPNIPALATVKYYKSVVDTMGGAKKTSDSVRLFMVPGMAHCGGGDGPNVFSMISALDTWVDGHKAPEQIIASKRKDGKVERTRPLCAYPQVAKYKGSGSTGDASNFSCSAP